MKVSERLRTFQDYRFNSLFFKNLRLLSLLILVPIAGAVCIGFYSYNSIQRNEVQAYSDRMADNVYAGLTRILRECTTELLYIGQNSNVELYLYDPNVRQQNYTLQNIQEVMLMPVLAKNYVDTVYLYSGTNGRVLSQAGVAPLDTFPDRKGLDQYLSQTDDRVLLVTTSEVSGYEKTYLAVFQDVRYGSKTYGVSAMYLDVESLMEELNLAEDQELYLTDGDRILLTNREELMDRSVEEIPGYERVVHGGIAMEKNSCMVSRLAENEDLEVIVRIREAGYQGALTLLGVMAALLGGMVFVTLGLSVFISLRLFQPIEKIMDALQSNRNILLGSEELFQEKDELTYILQTIQRTADVRKDVDKELAERVRLLKKAQAVALQSQINPHFLNNTMETINWTAIELLGGRNEISKMAGSLSKMLRMTLENSDTVVPVGEEIRHSMYYLEIQKIRYEDKFDVVWKIAPEVESCRIIRVVLQPLIENAIYHGIKPLTNKGLLTIRGYLNGETAELSVEDNGLGMTPEELNRLRENINGDVIKESAHIGLSNVNQRIRLYYGNEYGLIIDSREGIGTRVTIRFPRLQPSDPAASN